MRRWVLVPFVLIVLAAGACGGWTAAAPVLAAGGNLVPVTFQLDWIPFGRHAPYYVALDRGWYRDAGLDVKIVQGTGIVQAFTALQVGRAQFGFNDISYIPIAYEKSHVPLEALSVIYAHAPQAIFYLSGEGISRPKDLEGKTIAYSAGSSPYVLFALFARATGVNEQKIQWQQTSPQSLNAVLLERKVNGMVTYILTQPALQAQAPRGVRVDAFMFGDYGVPILNNGLITNRDWARQHPSVVRGFVQATMKGVQFALDHPADAIAIERKYQPNVTPGAGVAELNIIRKLIDTPAARSHCLGWIDPRQMQTTVDDVQKVFELKGPLHADEMYTDEYLACAAK